MGVLFGDVLSLRSAQLSDDAMHSGFDRGGGLEGPTVRYPCARPPRAAVSVCTGGAPCASCASDCVAGFLDLLESQPHHRSDPHAGLGLAEPRSDRWHRRRTLLSEAGADPARPALFSSGPPPE